MKSAANWPPKGEPHPLKGMPDPSAARRHPATTATWAWLEEGEGRERAPEEREYLADKIAEIDRLLFELDEGSAYVV